MSRRVTSCHVMSRHITSCHIMNHVIMSRIFLPSLLNSSNGGGVATTRFSKPWPCAGIRLGATLSLWRRVHCERARVPPCAFLSRSRGRLRGSGVFEACRGCAAGASQRCAVGIGFRARFVHAWSTCVSRGRLRGSCVLGGVSRACRGRAGGALPWGLGSGRVAHAHDFTRCDLRFAWQCGTSDALMRSGRHWAQ